MRHRTFFPEMTDTMFSSNNYRQLRKRPRQRRTFAIPMICCCMIIVCSTLLQPAPYKIHQEKQNEADLLEKLEPMKPEPSEDHQQKTDIKIDMKVDTEREEKEVETSVAVSNDMTESQLEEGVFVKFFRDLMLTIQGRDVPFLIRDGKLYCRQSHMDKLMEDRGSLRFRHYAQMIHAALQIEVPSDDHYGRVVSKIKGSGPGTGLPIVAKWDDQTGCSHNDLEYRSQPKLTWSHPIPPVKGCNCVGVPGYRAWTTSTSLKSEADWDRKFQNIEHKYPWAKKKKKALWRGGTTGQAKRIPGNREQRDFFSLPRTKLVQKSMENPHIIDAAFHKMTQYFAKRKDLEKKTRIARGVPMDDFMKYRAIIDIDGNGWSSRYRELLCMNSVVIKVRSLLKYTKNITSLYYSP